MNWSSEIWRPTGGARGEGSDRALLGCFRTNAANCEFPKVPRFFAFSTADLYEAPFQGSRRRHLPAAAAARPDGTPAGPGGCRHFRGRDRGGEDGWRVPERGRRLQPCIAGLPLRELAGEEAWAGRKPEEKGAGEPTLPAGTFAWPAGTPPGAEPVPLPPLSGQVRGAGFPF